LFEFLGKEIRQVSFGKSLREYGNRTAGGLVEFLRSVMKREYLVPLAIGLAFFVVMTSLKVTRIDVFREDTAVQFQATENIANRGVPVSQVFQSNLWMLEGSLIEPAARLAVDPLSPPRVAEENLLHFHNYLILYVLAAFVKFFPVNVVLLSAYVVSFAGIVLIAYYLLRGKRLPVGAACLFCLLIISHPAWSAGLLFGQFYPDRLFILAGFILMNVASRANASNPLLVAAAVLCALINEQAAFMAAVFLLSYTAVYWQKVKQDRYLRLGLGVALFFYGTIVVKFLLVTNKREYSSFLPHSLDQMIVSFQNPGFAHDAAWLVLINLPFLFIALFEWRAAIVAAVLLSPNIFGSIGGAEKVGWITHYHSYYLPALIWAALLGYEAAYRKAIGPKWRSAFYVTTVVLIVILNSVDPYSVTNRSVGLSNIANNFLSKFDQQVDGYLTSGRPRFDLAADEIRRIVPEKSVVSSVEIGMPLLYHNRTVWFYPLDIDRADYAVIDAAKSPKKVTYGGAINFLGPEELAKVNRVVLNRMKKDGYDFRHATFIPLYGVAVIKRLHPILP
jgi:multisubunit Na+/H+ antiporter MnhF subunit